MTVYLDAEDLVELATIILGTTPAVRDHGLLASAAARPATTAFGHEAYPDLWAKAAALLHSVCANHALVDGNKRLAWSATRVFLALNDVPLAAVDVDAAQSLMLAVADSTLGDVGDIAARLRKLLG